MNLPDSYDFYQRTNEAAHRLDGTRQTGGVRALPRGDFQEDVYTFNGIHSTTAESWCSVRVKRSPGGIILCRC